MMDAMMAETMMRIPPAIDEAIAADVLANLRDRCAAGRRATMPEALPGLTPARTREWSRAMRRWLATTGSGHLLADPHAKREGVARGC